VKDMKNIYDNSVSLSNPNSNALTALN